MHQFPYHGSPPTSLGCTIIVSIREPRWGREPHLHTIRQCWTRLHQEPEASGKLLRLIASVREPVCGDLQRSTMCEEAQHEQ